MTTPDRFISGAIDLGQIKARADAQAQAQKSTDSVGGIPSSMTVTVENLETEVIRRSLQVPVIVLIGTSASPDSEQLRNQLVELAQRSHRGFIFGYVDADHSPDLAQVFGVRGLPTVLVIAAGRPVTSFEGGQPAEVVEQWVKDIVTKLGPQLSGLPAEDEAEQVSEPRDPRYEAAEAALADEDYETAKRYYAQVLEEDPDNEDARRAYERTRLLERLAAADISEDPGAVADCDPHDFEKALVAVDADIAQGRVEEGLSRMISFLKGDHRDEARARLLELFNLFEPHDSCVIRARTAMASALF
ncbi:tetratricopeptide repeat protein [Corynebacterium poyangense]|uniref:Tetratricopeptide repeat protein n=1 Tax=Corynebacterium poyangense TaxID=2684405 RepID=A0A7H0SND9_9CORY|nr:tetratricopeptide repeat protein [Corynebacterium poyangense]MBZ8177092.1 tetratricopeptide repeat protein [Corynebacterium poyangense]QNQ90064.1 tetratricopeptide repeat protein [Corynebacterium poyangense]